MQAEIEALAELRDLLAKPADNFAAEVQLNSRIWWWLLNPARTENQPFSEADSRHVRQYSIHYGDADRLFEVRRIRLGAAAYTIGRDHMAMAMPPIHCRFTVSQTGYAANNGDAGSCVYQAYGHTPERALTGAVIAAEIGFRRGLEKARVLRHGRAL